MGTSTEANATKTKPAHLFVLVHGLLGGPNHMQSIEKCIKTLLPSESKYQIVTLRPSSFRFWKTFDGLKLNAERVVTDIFYEIETLRQENRLKVERISIVGYSLGGLISRYVIGILEEMGFFDTVEPIFFTTFATPHVGIEFMNKNLFDRTANALGQYLFGYTGTQMFLTDSQRTLVAMADPEQRYVRGLLRFQRHILLANVRNDRTVPFFTSYIADHSPFDQWSVVKIKYLKDLPQATIGRSHVRPKFVDFTRSCVLEPSSADRGNVQEGTSFWRRNRIARLFVVAAVMLLLLPIWIPFILTVSSWASLYSFFKVQILKTPQVAPHWDRVKSSVYGSQPVNVEDAEIGQSRRKQRRSLARHDTFKGDTSELTGNAMDSMLYAEARFTGKSPRITNDEETAEELHEEDTETELDEGDTDGNTDTNSETNELIFLKLTKGLRAVDIDAAANDAIIGRHLDTLKIKDVTKFPVFTAKTKLPLGEDKKFIVKNLNKIDWIKIPVYIDAWNAHDGIIARRGPRTNTKGTATIALWVSILRNHLQETEQKSGI